MNPYDNGLLRFTCHFCGIELEVPVELAGETAPCPSCGLLITAPGAQGSPAPEGQVAAEENQAQWDAVLAAQREMQLRSTEIDAAPEWMPHVVGVGQLTAAQPAMSPATLGDRMRTLPVEKKGRGAYFPLTVTLLSVTILSLSGMLIWRSELWRPGWGGTVAARNSAEAGSRNWAAGDDQSALAQARAESQLREMAEAAAPVRAKASPGGEEKVAVTVAEPVAEPVAAEEKPAMPPEQQPVRESPQPREVASVKTVELVQSEHVAAPQMAPETPAAVAEKGTEASPAEAAPVEIATKPESKEPEAPAEGKMTEVIPVAGMNPGGATTTAATKTKEDKGAEPTTALERARESIRKFLEADRWQERVPFIFDGAAKQTVLREYFQTHPDRAVKDFRLDFFHSETGKQGGLSMFVFFLTLEREEDGFPVIVKSDSDGKRFGVDWDLLVEFRDRHFAKFIEKKDSEPQDFRVVIQRVTYWEEDRDQIPGIEDLVCYKIDPPYPGFTQYSFVDKSSEEGKRMVDSLSWETDPLAAKVRVHWAKFPNGRPFLRVTDLVARSWAE